MTTARKRPAWWLALLTLTVSPVDWAGAQHVEKIGQFWGTYAAVNYATWDGLGDVQPAGRGGPFEISGHGIEFGGYTNVARWGPARLLAGVELGFLGFNSDVIFEADPKVGSALEMTYLTGSMTFRFGEPGGRYLDLDVGLGQYQADTMYIDCAAIVRCFSADTNSRTLGTYLGVSGTVGHGILLGARIHNASFDPIEAVGPDTGSLEGPVYSIFAGWEFGNWQRR